MGHSRYKLITYKRGNSTCQILQVVITQLRYYQLPLPRPMNLRVAVCFSRTPQDKPQLQCLISQEFRLLEVCCTRKARVGSRLRNAEFLSRFSEMELRVLGGWEAYAHLL